MRVIRLGAAVLAAGLGALSPSGVFADERQPVQSSPASEGVVAPEPHGNTQDDTWKSVLCQDDVQGVLGKEVRSTAGENMGRIIDVLVDQGGRVRGAVIDFGGFLGVGSRKVVVDWNALHFDPADQPDRISLDLTRGQVKEAPEYKPGKPVVVLDALGPSPAPNL